MVPFLRNGRKYSYTRNKRIAFILLQHGIPSLFKTWTHTHTHYQKGSQDMIKTDILKEICIITRQV